MPNEPEAAVIEPRELWVEVDGVSTHVLTAGSGPPLVYLHGVAPAGEWLPLHEHLAQQFTVYAPDHPGFGKTERPEWLTGVDDMVLHYEELFRNLELARPALVGFSLGGWIASAFAVTYPDRLSALALVNSAGIHVDGQVVGDLAALSREALDEAIFHDRQAADAYWKSRVHPEERLRQYRAMVTTALLAWNPWFDPKLERRLRRISAPTLVLWAEHDRLIPPVYGEAFRAAIPGAALETLTDCGHMAPIERPERVAEAIPRFVSSRSQRSSRGASLG